MKRYENVSFQQKYSIKIIEDFFQKFPEEKQGRKNFKNKEIQNVKLLIYEKIIKKGNNIKADCIGNIKEKNFLKKKSQLLFLILKSMDDNKILFVDLDGTLIKEDLSNLAFSHYLKKYPFRTLFYLLVFLFKGKPYLKEKISRNFDIPFEILTFNKAAFDFIREVKNRHRVVYLISGSHQILVDQMGRHLNIFLSLLEQEIILIW